MSENEKINIKSLQLNLSDEDQLKLVSKQLSELKKKGYEHITIDFNITSEQELKRNNIDVQVFKKIKTTQELPDWVVIKLMLAGGKLKRTKFKARSINE